MAKGTNKSVYKFKVTNIKNKEIKYFCTGNDVVNILGFPRTSIYYSMKHKNSTLGNYHFERIYIPKKLLHAGGTF